MNKQMSKNYLILTVFNLETFLYLTKLIIENLLFISFLTQ